MSSLHVKSSYIQFVDYGHIIFHFTNEQNPTVLQIGKQNNSVPIKKLLQLPDVIISHKNKICHG